MHSIQTLIEEIKHSPRLPDAVEELTAFWKDEQRRREQFYADLDEDIKAEFIDGQVVVHSPALDEHNLTRELIGRVIGTYVDAQNLGDLRSEKALIKLQRNDFEPDVVFFNSEKAEVIHRKTLFYPAPDWVCEVLSPSTERYDRKIKFDDYAGNGVKEYWIVDPEKREVEIYVLNEERYELATKTSSGMLQSRAIPGLSIPIESIFEKAACETTVFQILLKKHSGG